MYRGFFDHVESECLKNRVEWEAYSQEDDSSIEGALIRGTKKSQRRATLLVEDFSLRLEAVIKPRPYNFLVIHGESGALKFSSADREASGKIPLFAEDLKLTTKTLHIALRKEPFV